MNKNILLINLLLFVLACHEKEVQLPRNFSYTLVNTSEVTAGIKLITTPSKEFELTRADTFKIKPGEEIEFLKAEIQLDVSQFISAIRVMDPGYQTEYKTLNLSEKNIDGNTFRLTLWLPNPDAKDIVASSGVSMRYDISENSIAGFYTLTGSKTITYFTTQNEFKTIQRATISSPEIINDYGTVYRSGNTVIAANFYTYASATQFVMSQNNGIAWNTLISISNASNEDFMTTDFISPSEGWVVKYRDWNFTDIHKIANGVRTKIGSISGYCVNDVEFTDASHGFALANTSSNVSPADSRNTYFTKTTDGGATWSPPKLVDANGTPSGLIVFPSGGIAAFTYSYTSGRRVLSISSDNGMTWSLQSSGIAAYPFDIVFVNESLGLMKTAAQNTTYTGLIYKTVDQGKTWQKFNDNLAPGTSLKFFNDQTGYVMGTVSDGGRFMYVTRDGGTSWKELLFPYAYMQ
jgi:hypothetical protein